MDNTLLVLDILGTRWRAATVSATSFKQLATASGEEDHGKTLCSLRRLRTATS
jgi:hypothetical protein